MALHWLYPFDHKMILSDMVLNNENCWVSIAVTSILPQRSRHAEQGMKQFYNIGLIKIDIVAVH